MLYCHFQGRGGEVQARDPNAQSLAREKCPGGQIIMNFSNFHIVNHQFQRWRRLCASTARESRRWRCIPLANFASPPERLVEPYDLLKSFIRCFKSLTGPSNSRIDRENRNTNILDAQNHRFLVMFFADVMISLT